jgi:hypothetical protein
MSTNAIPIMLFFRCTWGWIVLISEGQSVKGGYRYGYIAIKLSFLNHQINNQSKAAVEQRADQKPHFADISSHATTLKAGLAKDRPSLINMKKARPRAIVGGKKSG